MMQAIADLQAEKVPRRSRRKPVKVLLPVNLRTLFPSRSLRNFASYITPEIDPRTGDYTFSEICAAFSSADAMTWEYMFAVVLT